MEKVSRKAVVFVPFLGDFLSINAMDAIGKETEFSSPFLGTFFQFAMQIADFIENIRFSSPFLGTFFQ